MPAPRIAWKADRDGRAEGGAQPIIALTAVIHRLRFFGEMSRNFRLFNL
jgi:hypothetical protein